MAAKKVKINRAPVLTLWATLVAERLGHERPAALTLGKAIAGLSAQAKGRRLGIYGEPREKEEAERPKPRKAAEPVSVDVMGRSVPAARTAKGIRATEKGEPMDPKSVQRYLERKFGEDLADVEAALRDLARSFEPEELDAKAYGLYGKFRPEVPMGKKGWGAAGELDLDRIRRLAR